VSVSVIQRVRFGQVELRWSTFIFAGNWSFYPLKGCALSQVSMYIVYVRRSMYILYYMVLLL
jgi:hypothetical protein